MREIKFRGIPIYGNEFVYGYLDIYRSESGFKHQIRNNDNGLTLFDVKPETVGQWTGLLDRLGKEIYEGDIWVVFSKEHPGKKLEEITIEIDLSRTLFNGYRASQGEIIGNIYENPELLKGGDK